MMMRENEGDEKKFRHAREIDYTLSTFSLFNLRERRSGQSQAATSLPLYKIFLKIINVFF